MAQVNRTAAPELRSPGQLKVATSLQPRDGGNNSTNKRDTRNNNNHGKSGIIITAICIIVTSSVITKGATVHNQATIKKEASAKHSPGGHRLVQAFQLCVDCQWSIPQILSQEVASKGNGCVLTLNSRNTSTQTHTALTWHTDSEEDRYSKTTDRNSHTALCTIERAT